MSTSRRQLIDFSQPGGDHGSDHQRPRAAVRVADRERRDRHVPRRSHRRQRRTSRPAPTPPTQVAAAFWGAVGQVYAGTKGAGRVIAAAAPQMLGLLGPLFPFVNPQDAQSSGFQAVNYGQGPAGAISGVPIYITAGLADNKILVLSTAAAEVYETRVGALAGRRALRARCPGRLRRPLHPARHRRHWGSSRSPRRHERADGRPQPAGARARPALGGRHRRRRGRTAGQGRRRTAQPHGWTR